MKKEEKLKKKKRGIEIRIIESTTHQLKKILEIIKRAQHKQTIVKILKNLKKKNYFLYKILRNQLKLINQ